jgi:hypothetical protein
MNNKIQVNVLEKYLDALVADKFHRYGSWDNCFKTFSEETSTENHSLQLGFYLASWGMYRGSSGLLQKNHLIHQGAVSLVYLNKFRELRCSEKREISKESVLILMELKKELANYYKRISFVRGIDELNISSTDTLISKILLGTMGCVPAFDRYFRAGIKATTMSFLKFDETSLNRLFDFAEFNRKEIKEFQKKIALKLNRYYPIMKILDMYFWQIGYDKVMEKKELIAV